MRHSRCQFRRRELCALITDKLISLSVPRKEAVFIRKITIYANNSYGVELIKASSKIALLVKGEKGIFEGT